MTVSGTHIYCIGASYKTAPQNFRELLHFDAQCLASCMKNFALANDLKELVVLSTCNRVEIYWTSASDFAHDVAHKLFSDLILLTSQRTVTPETLKENSYFFQNEKAVTHLFRVVSSLDSLIVGETQITGQFKDAIGLAFSAKTLGPILDRLANDALALSKKIRSQTGIGRKTVSISHAAIDLAKRIYRDIDEQHFLFIGAGEMTRLAASYALNYSPKQLWFCNRSVDKAKELADNLGAGTAHSLSELKTLLCKAEIVICATNAGKIIVNFEMLSAIMKKRKKPIFIADISIPRNIDPECATLDNVYLFEVDSLKEIVEDNLDERKKAADKALNLIERSEQRFLAWMNTLELRPAISGFRSYLDLLLLQELNKSFASKELDIDEHLHKALTSFTQSVSAKMVADVATTLQNTQGAHREQLTQAVRLLFPLRNPSQEEEEIWVENLVCDGNNYETISAKRI